MSTNTSSTNQSSAQTLHDMIDDSSVKELRDHNLNLTGQTTYQAFLEIPDNSNTKKVALQIAAFSLEEGYNGGWSGTAMLVSHGDTPSSLGTLLGAALTQKVMPGYQVVLHLTLGGDDQATRGVAIRSWPCMVSRVEPVDIEGEHLAGACAVGLMDPVSYLSGQQVWGVYQSCSAGAIIGGVLSLAAGGDGKPSLEPVVPGLPVVKVVEEMRDGLSDIPYALAVGQPMGEWIGDFLGRVGLRLEMTGSGKEGSVTVRLSDHAPRGTPLQMQVLVNGGTVTADAAGPDRVFLTSLSARPGLVLREQLLDNPSLGSLRRLGPGGTVGRLFLGPSVDLDEAQRRAQLVLQSGHAEMLHVSVASRQPLLRPGRLLGFDLTISGARNWQTAWVKHSFGNGQYNNNATLLRGDAKWCPPEPLPRPPMVVSGIVDGGPDYNAHQPVLRNRLGQIPVSFPFTQTTEENENPRIHLTVIQPMAGGLHGFISAHRHGDTCRVAVHTPFWAEIVGFQYRSNRQINAKIVGATTGIVVEHNNSTAWSGMVFRPSEDIEQEQEQEQ